MPRGIYQRKKDGFELEDEQEFYLSRVDDKGITWLYKSEQYKFSEIDILNLIKILVVEARCKSIGEKILEVYRDSIENHQEKLKKIGIEHQENAKPNREKKPNIK